MRIDSGVSSYLTAQRTNANNPARGFSVPAAAAFANGAGADTVTISSVAKQAAAKAADSRNPGWSIVLRNAEEDPTYAEKAAYDFAYDDSHLLHGPMVDITKDPICYSGTDEPVTEEGIAAFKAQAALERSQLIALYQSEKAKGTPDAKILQTLFDARDAQPSSYLERLHWK